MRAKNWGRVITSTSSSVKQPLPTLMLSNTVRSATTAWSKTLSDQVAADGITVNTAGARPDQDRAHRADRCRYRANASGRSPRGGRARRTEDDADGSLWSTRASSGPRPRSWPRSRRATSPGSRCWSTAGCSAGRTDAALHAPRATATASSSASNGRQARRSRRSTWSGSPRRTAIDAATRLGYLAARTQRMSSLARAFSRSTRAPRRCWRRPRRAWTRSRTAGPSWAWAPRGRRSSRAGTACRTTSRCQRTREIIEICRMVWRRAGTPLRRAGAQAAAAGGSGHRARQSRSRC